MVSDFWKTWFVTVSFSPSLDVCASRPQECNFWWKYVIFLVQFSSNLLWCGLLFYVIQQVSLLKISVSRVDTCHLYFTWKIYGNFLTMILNLFSVN